MEPHTNKIDLAKVDITNAKETDAEEVFAIVCAAYIIELGNTGVAFKKKDKNRYLSVEQAAKEIKDSIIIPDGSEKPQIIYLVARYEEKIIGCIRGCIEKCEDGALVCEQGPIAVSPEAQGSGLGTQMIKKCE
jgi:ribosomal protein S18 acetylase RimI-like enzyme